jgi:TRAP-type C4-dicarboxylate transport system permease small subunit
MPFRLRLILAILGLLLCLCAAAALIYAAWPVEVLRDHAPVAPTLFAPPASALVISRWL